MMNRKTHDIKVMTSGAFTAAYLELIPQLELLIKKKIVTMATSIGTGENSIPNRLKRGEAVDVVMVADAVLREFIRDGLVLSETYTPVARSVIGMAVRAGAPIPDISTTEALKRTLLRAESIAYSASVSGQYISTELYQRLGIADQVTSKSRLIGGGSESVPWLHAGRRRSVSSRSANCFRARDSAYHTTPAGTSKSLTIFSRCRRKYHGFGTGLLSDQIPRVPRGSPRHHKKRT